MATPGAADMAVISSLFVLVALSSSFCSAGTLNARPAFPVQTGQIQPSAQSSKQPGRRVMNPAFANAGRTPGLEIWRIENFEPVVYPKNNYGKFYTGDSFIVLNTIESQKDKKLSWDVHFWLGSETSTDEAGAAAILTVQLDDLLNGGPVQHREVQDHESQLFLGYFKNGIRYEQGGVGTGFKHVQTNAQGEKRLFQVKGKRNVRVRQVNLSVSSMNKGDCFILDAGSDIYVFVGSQAKRVEKLKAISAANQIRDQDHNGRARVQIIDDFSTDSDKQQFFDVLGSGSADQVPEESTADEDGAFERTDAAAVSLYKVSDGSGKLQVDAISQKPLTQAMLDTRECFILDTGSGIFVWVGKGATQKEKTDAMSKAQEFLRSKKYPAWTQIHRIVEGAESAPFKQYFATWRDVGMAHTRLIRSALDIGSDESLDVDEIDAVMTQLKKSGGRAFGFMPDHGQNSIETITQYVAKPGSDEIQVNTVSFEEGLPLLGFGSYVLTYNYEANNGDTGSVTYVWQGLKAPAAVEERAFNEGLAVARSKVGLLVLANQDHEPRHFYKIFKGKLLTSYTALPVTAQLFRIRGTVESDIHASEVPADSSSLASGDAFALLSGKSHKIYIWNGLGASVFEKKAALDRFSIYWEDVEIEQVEEGAEPEEFWDELNGEGQYDRSLGDLGAPLLESRLFHCRVSSAGLVRVEEVAKYEQEDLDSDDIMLLDAGDEIYLWVGSGASEEENQKILDMAKRYILLEPTARSFDTVSIIRVPQGKEPNVFKRMFPDWDDHYWKNLPSYEDIRRNVNDANNEV
ncbi:gelsolin isoform X1 [Drosophila takahashii]|uniref:gelsolin isoform X1 n=2 Tax=Drosophila takahashii TaxID=29030 RepID=UPI001CF8445E|nr:gelsolin isoform X1 [Drosophila takahashii]XP_016992686.2 gelsolin isoform X1 [Drosophila takahashii]